jgi:hypothetical protein
MRIEMSEAGGVCHKRNIGFLPWSTHAHDKLILVNTITILVSLQFLYITMHVSRHIIGGNPALLNVLAG